MRKGWHRALIGMVLIGGIARAEEAPCLPSHTFQRAGNPQIVACYAVPSDTGAYIGYQVGGGCPFKKCGEHPTPQEGTWGWDYHGRCLKRNVFLRWWHGRCDQGGTGAYATEKP